MKHTLLCTCLITFCCAYFLVACSGKSEQDIKAEAPSPVTALVETESNDNIAPADSSKAESSVEVNNDEEEEDFWADDTPSDAAPIPLMLSEYPFFQDLMQNERSATLFPYSLNNEHFSDYSTVSRFFYIPAGAKLQYQESGALQFPAGSILIQTFGYPKVMSASDQNYQRIETRLLMHQNSGWEALAYQWKEDGSDARKSIAGGLVTVNWIDKTSQSNELRYVIPNKNDCKRCHENKNTVSPIGITAGNLNKNIGQNGAQLNQLTHWNGIGILDGLPDSIEQVPMLAQWDNPESGSLDDRARAWLAVNCAHCHNPDGAGNVSGLDLSRVQSNPMKLGIFKPPVAAGRSSEGLKYSIDPGSPQTSFMINRLTSTDPSVMMPPLGRRLPDNEAVALISEWISAMHYDEKDTQRIIEQQNKDFEYLKVHGKWPSAE